MPARARAAKASSQSIRTHLVERLRERMPEIEREAITRLYGISSAPERPDPGYADGLRSATRAALEYLLAGVERGETDSVPLPPAVLAQARLAARHRIGLDTVLRRCLAGHALFDDFLMEGLEQLQDTGPDLAKRLLREQAALFDRMVAAVSEEHRRDAASRSSVTEKRRTRLVEGLLAGEPLEAAELGYDLQDHHLAAVAKGPAAGEAIRGLANVFDRRLLVLSREDSILWAWMGGKDPLDTAELLRRVSAVSSFPMPQIALGEPAEGREGWRRSHRQAAAALPIALRGNKAVVRYGDVALLAAALHDDLLATSLREIYLRPLEVERDGGEVLYSTLRAYFGAGRNVSSAAAALGVNRNTVASRLRFVEARIGRSLAHCAAELETALSLRGTATQ